MGFIRERKTKKGGKRFQAEIRLKGHPMLSAVFDRKSDARTWIMKVETDIRCGRQQIYSEGKRHTFAEAVERYFKEMPISVVKRGHLLWWKKELGSLFLHDVRPSIISELKQKLLSQPNEKGVVRCGSTCNRYLASLSHLLTQCVKQWEWVNENPVRKIAREKEPQGRTRFLSPAERKQLLDACRISDNPLLFTFVVILLSTGFRYNEARNLRWSDVDLHHGKATIYKSKNGDVRSVPIRGLALELLRNLSSQSLSIGFVFPSKNKAKPIEFRRAFRTAIKRSGLSGFRGHDCRHSYATELMAHGLTLGEIGPLLGHRSLSVTKKYSHLMESRSSEAISKMSEQIFQGVGNE